MKRQLPVSSHEARNASEAREGGGGAPPLLHEKGAFRRGGGLLQTPGNRVAADEKPLRYRLREGHLIQVDDATSARMAGIRQKSTRPELLVGKALRALGHRYRLTNRDLPGSPDFANRRAGWVLFVQGCFWHRHGCRATTTPTRNREFWEAKFARNLARDARTADELRAHGYRVIVIWECETKRGDARVLELLRIALAQPDPGEV